MKRKKLLILPIILFVLFFTITKVKADSGWDYDYDSGSSWSSGSSSWDSSSDWGSSSSWDSSSGSYSNSADSLTWIILGIQLIITGIIILSCTKSTSSKNEQPQQPNKELESQKILEIDPSMNIEEFKKEVYETYKKVQIAWMNFDLKSVRDKITDEMYNMYTSQLETLKIKNQKNIMSDFELRNVTIINMEKKGEVISVDVELLVSFYDYVINEKTEKVVRGNKNQKVTALYLLTFIKSATDNKTEEKCPSCGATVDIVTTAICPYCKNVLVKTASKYVLSKKRILKQ